MNIAEFFVSLGIKGADESISKVSGVTEGMNNLFSAANVAKASILAAFYALEQMTAGSNKTGTELKEFSVLTGMSARTLQQYEYAAQQAVGHNVKLADTFINMQNAIKGMLGGEGSGAFKTLGQLVNALHTHGINVSMKEAAQWMTNIPLLIQRMQQVALLKNIGAIWKRHIIEGMGAQPDFTEVLMLGGVTPGKVAAAKGHTLSDHEVDNLVRAATAWANMNTNMDLAIGKLNARFGVELAENVERIVKALLGPPEERALIPALIKLADKLQVFKGLNYVLSETAAALTALSQGKVKEALGIRFKMTGLPWLIHSAALGIAHSPIEKIVHNYFSVTVPAGTNNPVAFGTAVGKAAEAVITRAYLQNPSLTQEK